MKEFMKIRELVETKQKTFRDVYGEGECPDSFNFPLCKIDSLEGSPKEVNENFYCNSNQLTSLEGAPQKIGGDFDCSYYKITSLKGAPQKVEGSFYCTNNQLTSLEFCPTKIITFDCSYNQLVSLKGSPPKVGGNFLCSHNQLTSLEGAPQTVNGYFYCTDNKLTSLKDIHKQIHEIDGEFYATRNPIKSYVLGLLKIKDLKRVHLDNEEVEKILNKYLGEGNVGLIKAQRELIEADLDDYAEL